MADTKNDRSTPAEKFSRACERLGDYALSNLIEKQTDLVHFRNLGQFETGNAGGDELRPADNAEVWRMFITQELYDTSRLVLEEFHLFDWFPLAPGKFHTPHAERSRRNAFKYLERSEDGETYFNPMGKGLMIEGGVGTVHMLPREIEGEPHYFMTASSTGVCHEGFPALIPRRFYGPLKAQMRRDGAASATISGEMRYLPEGLRTLFGHSREVPLLYLHVDEPPRPARPRSEVTNFEISVAVSFRGKFEGHEDTYATFATFDPAAEGDRERASRWIERVYVAERYEGAVLTDFDESHPVFPAQKFSMNVPNALHAHGRSRKAVFALRDVMSGRLNLPDALSALRPGVVEEGRIQIIIENYQQQINTGGGAYVGGNVDMGGGQFVGRDDN